MKERTEEIKIEILKMVGISKGYRLDCPEDWYGGINREDILKCGGEKMTADYVSFILKHHNDTIRKIFPKYEFLEWKFKVVTRSYFDNKDNIKYFLKWLEKEMGWNKSEDWYEINKKHIKKYAPMLLWKYNLMDLPKILYPDYEFLDWKFNLVIRNYWDKKENQIKYLHWLQNHLGWHKPEDWYNVSRDVFEETGGELLVQKYKMMYPLKVLYPNFEFDPFKFKFVPYGFWNDFENLKNILLPKCIERGRMLTSDELYDLGWFDAVTKHGGVIEVAKILNVSVSTQYKCISGNVVKSIPEVIVDNFLFLNNIDFKYENKIIDGENYLYDFKIGDIFIEVWGYYGKEYNAVRKEKEQIYKNNNLKLISLDSSLFVDNKVLIINEHLMLLMISNKIKTDGFYCDDLNKLKHYNSYNKDVAINELKEICKKENFKEFPTVEWWRESKYSKLMRFLLRAMTIYEICTLLGFYAQKPSGYWNDFENLKKELLPICEELNNFPTGTYLNEIGRSDVLHGINNNGGIYLVASKLGYKINRKPNNYWENIDNVICELKPICDELGKFPTQSYLLSIGKSDLMSAMQNWHKGSNVVASKMGYETKKQANNYWGDFENFKRELLPICEELKEFPSSGYLKSIDREDILGAIMQWYGGFHKAPILLGYEPYQKQKGYWKNFENVKNELLDEIQKTGKTPTYTELQARRNDLMSGIKNHHGGYEKVKFKLNLK